MSPREIGLFITVIVFIADQVSKAWILYVVDLDVRGRIPVLPFFDLTMVWNRGVSFGLFAAQSQWHAWTLVAFSALVVVFLLRWMFRTRSFIATVAIGMIVGGALGNMVDRLLYGAVADFLDFSGLMFPFVFNVADAGITLGVCLLVLEAFFGKDAGESGQAGRDPRSLKRVFDLGRRQR